MRETAIDTQLLSKEYGNGRGCRDVTITVGKGKPSASSVPTGPVKAPL